MVTTRPYARAALALLLALVAGIAGAQPTLDQVRGRVLRTFGVTTDLNVNLFPFLDPVSFVHTVTLPRGADSFRLHFEILQQDTTPDSWRIEVLNPRRELVWSRDARDVAGGGLWTGELLGNQATVRVISKRADNEVRIKIDRAAVATKPSKPLSITDHKDSMKPILGQDPWIKAAGTSVARLLFVSSTDRLVYSCTAFLVTDELLLTNHHCIATNDEMDSALVDFDFDSESATPVRTTLRELVATSDEFDYSMLRLVEKVARTPLKLDTHALAAADALLVIEHAGGLPKKVSREDCWVTNPSVVGSVAAAGLTDFTHHCDTMSSSSGSPVLSLASQTVVGLHHLGFKETDQTLENRAVHIENVIADMHQRRPDVDLPVSVQNH